MGDLIALITIILWPVIPLFWIPLHCFPGIFRKIGLFTYLIPLVTWFPLALVMILHRGFIVQLKTHTGVVLNILGTLLLILGIVLHIRTGILLSVQGLAGLPELSADREGRLLKEGPYSVVRHPTYLAHTLMFSGIFLMTGVVAVGIVTVLDFAIVNLVIIPLEEKELLTRFSEDYARYMQTVPRLLPSRRGLGGIFK
ncbi:MAG TPA: isoprenylcysteine carboxylmethyltransferase family protein [Thermodesulfovibrionales bacterium]|nr:isoprenylcysteine carboxylmethyltransferase family protein [Thermodesulfovibrionales bacterium]